MATQKFILVVYDISNDRRRTKLHNVLLDYGTPVQYSVFECLLNSEDVVKMKQAVLKVIRKRVDRVRFYELCADCVSRTEVTSGVESFSSSGKTLLV
ncbi:CRISPR-associated endonuclease Cas2 [Anaerolinea sp.]|uniref:CRISPR-associated endonuclease Cas2 n=1 Tax=Anaerolinea sp. TaxID=1872519 RepID=UPI002ACD53DF|nr:CRISPR-associated endonuclease Cas2 [Anaerolinea sp.]